MVKEPRAAEQTQHTAVDHRSLLLKLLHFVALENNFEYCICSSIVFCAVKVLKKKPSFFNLITKVEVFYLYVMLFQHTRK